MSGPKVGPLLPHILEEDVSDEILLYDDERKLFVSLNETAADIWRLSTGAFSADEIVSMLASSYGKDPDVIRLDVDRVIVEFVDQELIPPVT